MSIRSTSLAPKSSSSPLDIKPAPLSIRTLDRKKSIAPAVDRVRGEFREMRGFSPTLPQAAKLFNLSVEECDRILMFLVQDGSLLKGDDGRFRLVHT
jgi:hypothetical protein